MTPPEITTTNSAEPTKYIREFTVEDKDQEKNGVTAAEIVAAIVVGQEVLIRNAIITGPFDLDSKTINARITIEDSSFEGPFAASYALFNQLVSFKGSSFLFDHLQDSSSNYSVTFKTATFAKGLLVENAIFKGDVDFTNATLFELLGSAVTFDQGVTFNNIVVTKSMICSNAVFKGALVVTGKIRGIADFSGVHFDSAEATVSFVDAQIVGDIIFSPVEVGGKVQPTIFAGGADFINMRVGGQADFTGVQFANAEVTVSFEVAQIESYAFFRAAEVGGKVQPTIFAGGANFINMRVGGEADFSGVHFANSEATVSFIGAQIVGDVMFSPIEVGGEVQSTIFAGGADFLNMRVGGQADFSGVHFANAKVTVSFAGTQIERSAYFRAAEVGGKVQPTIFAGGADFINMRVGGQAEFSGVHFANSEATVSFIGVQIVGDVMFSPIEVGGEVQSTIFAGGANFLNMRVGGQADFTGVQFANAEVTVSFAGAQIERSAYFRAAEVGGEVQPTIFAGGANFLNMRVGGQAEFDGVHFANAEVTVSFAGAQIERSAYFRAAEVGGKVQPTIFAGGANFLNMRVGGQADFTGVQFANAEVTVSFEGAQIERSAFFRAAELGGEVQPTIFAGGANFINMRVGGEADFSGVHFANSEATVSFIGVQIVGDVMFSPIEVGGEVQSTIFAGGADFLNMRVGGQADFTGVHFANAEATVSFSGTQIERSAYFRAAEVGGEVQPTIFAGGADFINMRVGGEADFSGVHFDSAEATVSFIGAQIVGDVTFSPIEVGGEVQSTIFAGGANFLNMRVGGIADFSGVHFANAGAKVSFESTRFDSNLNFSETTFAGPVEFNVLRAQNNVLLRETIFKHGVTFDNAHIVQHLDLTEATFTGNLILKDSYIGVIDFGQESININKETFINLRGTHYTRITPDKVWKQLTNKFDPENYDRQPYTQLENTLREAGNDDMADEVYIRRQNFETFQLLRRNIPKGIFALLYWFVAGYGVRTWRLILLSVGFVLFGWWMFMQPGSVMSATDPNANSCTDDQLDWQDAFMVSLTTFLPINFPIDEIFTPSPCEFTLPILNATMQFVNAANIMIFFGWILVPVGIATLSGLLRRLP